MNRKVFEKFPHLCVLVARVYNRLSLRNKINIGKANTLNTGFTLFKKVKIHVIGKGNQITIEDFAVLHNCSIYIHGDNNKIAIGKRCSLRETEFYVEDSNNVISLGAHTSIHGKTHLAAIEGTKILIGDDCMFSSNVHFSTGDSHSIVNLDNKRINPSQDIKIGNHVWVGTKVTCLKNTEIADNCIVAATATVCGKHLTPNCIIGGVPAKILKTDINWLRQRI